MPDTLDTSEVGQSPANPTRDGEAKRAPIGSGTDEDKETASLGGAELDLLIKESAPNDLGDLDTNTMAGNEIDRLLAEVKKHGKADSEKPPPVAAQRSTRVGWAPLPKKTEADRIETPVVDPSDEALRGSQQTIPAPPPQSESMKATKEVEKVVIPTAARRSDMPPSMAEAPEPTPIPKVGLRGLRESNGVAPAPQMTPDTEREVRAAEAMMREGGARRRKIGAGVAVTVALGAAVFVVKLAAYDPREELEDAAPAPLATTASAPSIVATTAPSPTAATTATAIATKSADAAKAESDARAALTRFGDGLRECVKHAIGVLPGSSPAVPSAPSALKGAGYTPLASDFRTPVWMCAKMHVDAPMRFVLQWQSIKPETQGQAVAWIDADGDGTVDEALVLRATLKSRGVAEMGAVETLDKSTPILSVQSHPASNNDSVY